MIKSVTVQNPAGSELKLELANPDPSGLIVAKIDGLGPTNANISTTELATTDGSIYNSARQEQRNIVMTLQMMFAPTIEDARQKTYRFFPVKKQVKLTIETDRRRVYTYGYVESNEPDIFSQNEQTQISILCTDPYFHDVATSSFGFYGVDPKFEFPFSNESLTDDLLTFGELSFDTELSLNYTGDADTGVVFRLFVRDQVSPVTIYNAGTREMMRLNTDKIKTITGTAFGTGDEILVSTVKGDKWVRLRRNGIYTNVISILDKDADWFQLTNGTNVFGFMCDEGLDNIQLEMTYSNAYEGV